MHAYLLALEIQPVEAGKLTDGDIFRCTRAYLVEAAAPEYGSERTVRAIFELF